MPGHFQALMDHLCKGMKIGVYLDDLIVYSNTPSEMLETLEKLMKKCLGPKKSVFGTAYTEFLGIMAAPRKCLHQWQASLSAVDNPAETYMGLSVMQGEEEYVGALIKGCTEEVCTKYSAALQDTKPEVAQCFQTKALTTFQDDLGSSVFHDSQFESLEYDNAEYLN